MSSVPSTEWHCSLCSERIAAREARAGHAFKDVDSFRDRAAEDRLESKALEQKLHWEEKGTNMVISGTSQDDEEDTTPVLCAYCGMDELDMCSPLVVGQCRSEHDDMIARSKVAVAHNTVMFPDKR